MTDSESDYNFESADEGEGLSPRTKEKHYQTKASDRVQVSCENADGVNEEVVSSAEDKQRVVSSAEKQAGDDQSVVSKKDENEASNENNEVVISGSTNTDDGQLTSREGIPRTDAFGDKLAADEVSLSRSQEGESKLVKDSVCEKEVSIGSDAGDTHHETSKDLASGDNRTCEHTNEQENTVEFTSLLEKMSLSDKASTHESHGMGWGSWGMSVLSTATSSVSTFTSQVGEGLATVLEGVESTFGAPSPEELAKQETERLKSAATKNESTGGQEELMEDETQPSLMGLLTGVSGVIEKTGTKVLSSGLDTLEFLGKKTMDVLQENDPGLKKKRGLFQTSKPNLSEALREAKQKAETCDSDHSLNPEESKKIHYTTLFDDFQGLIHLEALEMLSKQSEARIPSLRSTLHDSILSSIEDQLEAISNFCDLEDMDDDSDDDEDDHNFTECANKVFSELPVPSNSEKLIQAHVKSRLWLEGFKATEGEVKPDSKEMHIHAMESLAELTAKGVEVFHKTSELILSSNQAQEIKAAEALASIAKLICKELNFVAAKYCDAINVADNSEAGVPNNSLITDVFLEASNSNVYIQDALKLTSPVLQVSLLENAHKVPN